MLDSTCAGLPSGFNAQRLYSRTRSHAFIASYDGDGGGCAIGLSQNLYFNPITGAWLAINSIHL